MIKKAVTIFMGILMVAGVFLAVANFTASDLNSKPPDVNGHWTLVAPYPWPVCVPSGSQCVVGSVWDPWVPIPKP